MRKLGTNSVPPVPLVDQASYEAVFDQPLSSAQVAALGQLYGLSPPSDLGGAPAAL